MAENVHPQRWRRACESGECVEVRVEGDEVLVRGSRDPDGPVLSFTHAEWRAFCAAVVRGELTV